jgi:hypothetical protein
VSRTISVSSGLARASRDGFPFKSPHSQVLTKLVALIRARVESARSSCCSAIVSDRSMAWNS